MRLEGIVSSQTEKNAVSPRLFLGVDGGQSSTTAVIADENASILGIGTSGPCNHVGATEAAAKLKRVVEDCVGKACEQANLLPGKIAFESTCFGMSGGPDDKRTLLSEIINTGILQVTDDATIALAGALGGRPGVVTISGTGSISLGIDATGRRARAGGWGYVFGDEGSAFDIVRQALRAALRHEEEWAPPTKLRDFFLQETGYETVNGVLHGFYTAAWPRSRVATLALGINTLDDSIAHDILDRAAAQLASYALAVRRRLWAGSLPVSFSYVGGVFHSHRVLNGFRAQIEADPSCKVIAPLCPAPAGALIEAYRAAGVSPDLNKLLTSKF